MIEGGYASSVAEQLAEGWMPQALLVAVLFLLVLLGLGLAVTRRSQRLGPVVAVGVLLAGGLAALFGMALNRLPTVLHHDPDAITIRVRAHQWRWEFEQPNGMIEGELKVPVNRTVRLLIRSEPNGPESPAVIHRLSVPALGIRALAVPGQTTEVTFFAERTGRYDILCTELCGAGHSRMRSAVEVMTQEAYDTFGVCDLRPAPDSMTWLQWGEQLFASNGCTACHSVDGSPGGVGPDLMNVAGMHRWVEGDAYVLADDGYLMRAIVEPTAEISAGYTAVVMPAFNLPQSQLDAMLAYLHSISAAPPYLRARAPYGRGPFVPAITPRGSPRD